MENMELRWLLRTFIIAVLCLMFAGPGRSGSLPSKGEIIGLSVAAGVTLGVGAYLMYHFTHKHASIQGCVTSDQNGLSLRNEKDKKTYFLAGDSATLKSEQRVALSGKKQKDSSGKLIFQVQKLTKDLGTCQP